MQLSEIRINLCGPASSHSPPHTPPAGSVPMHPRIAQSHPSQSHSGNGSTADGCRDGARGGRLRAFCSLTFDHTFVVRDVKLIEGNDGLFLAMPSRKLCDRCRRCSEKNHLRARFCNQCGSRLDENRSSPRSNGNGNGHPRGLMRPKLHADIAHPINAACRLELERRVLMAYLDELERSKLPGYVAPNLDGDYSDYDEVDHVESQPTALHLRRTGTE
jgi:stage V sporulation protein G